MSFRIATIGFGEAGQTFCAGADWCSEAISYDRLIDDPHCRSMIQSRITDHGLACAETTSGAVSDAEIVLSLVTADQAISASEAAKGHMNAGSFFFDMNSVAPQTKQTASRVLGSREVNYIDAAIMSPVYPAGRAVPILLSGPNVGQAQQLLSGLGFSNVMQAGDKIGQASTIKMLRSIMIKGIEALTAECVLAANKAGALDAVLAALGDDWAEKANYNLDRMMIHGTRRAAEMEEVVKTIQDLGMQASMTAGTVQRQAAIGSLNIKTPPDALKDKLALLTGEESIK